MDIWQLNKISYKVIGAAMEVHRELGPGLSENIYEEALIIELQLRNIEVKQQVYVPVHYKGRQLEHNYKIDLIVEDEVIVELKAANDHHDVHTAQLLSYLKVTNKQLGLLINFKFPLLKDGVKRILNGMPNNTIPFNIDTL
jgi:GxxExxY protein